MLHLSFMREKGFGIAPFASSPPLPLVASHQGAIVLDCRHCSPTTKLPIFFSQVCFNMIDHQHLIRRQFKFFRVLLNDFNTELAIPQRLTNYFIKGNLTLITLLSPIGKSWNVRIGGDTKGLHFAEGWERFAAAHGLSFGDFLVFEYIDNIVFQVTIFDKSTCERDHYKATNGIAGDDAPAGDQNGSEKECFEMCHSKQTSSSGKRSTPITQQESKIKGLRKPICRNAKEARKHGCKRHSYFEIIISPKCKKAVNIPAKFARSNFDLSSLQHQMLLRDTSGGHPWPVKLHHYKQSVGHHAYLLLANGWQDFCIGNDLKDGDVCIFKLKKKNEMLVQIRRSCRGANTNQDKCGNSSKSCLQQKGSPSKLVAGVSKPPDPLIHYFRSTIVPTNVRKKGYLTIPRAFRSLVDLSAEEEAVLVDPSSRQWPVKIYHHKQRRCRIGNGWLAFCEDNNLEVGDVCVFNFKYRGREVTFQVEVIKCSKAAGGKL